MKAILYTTFIILSLPLFLYADSTPPIGAIVLDSITQVNPSDGLENGSVSIHASGSNLIFYSIDNGLNFQEDSIFTDLAAGDYAIVLTDGLACVQQYTIQLINEPDDCESLAENFNFEFRTVGDPTAIGDQFFIECYATGFMDVLSFQFSLEFDSQILQFEELNDIGSPLIGELEQNSTTTNLPAGFLSISWLNLNLEGQTIPDGPIFKIFFEVVGGTGDCFDFYIPENSETEIAIELNNGDFCVLLDLNHEFIPTQNCIQCTELFANYSSCDEITEIYVCGGIPPYNYTFEGNTGLIDEGTINAADTLTYIGLDQGAYQIGVIDDQGDIFNLDLEVPATSIDTMFSSIQVCNEPSSIFSSVVDFTQFLIPSIQNCPYIILDPNGDIVSNPNVDFTGQFPGQYIFNFVVDKNNCQDIYGILVNVLECNCPTLDLSPLGNFCSDDTQSINLLDFLLPGTGSGSFTILDSNEQAYFIQPGSDGIISLDGFDVGSYTLVYMLDDSPPDCPNSVSSTLTIIEEISPTFTAPPAVCNSDETGETTILDFSTLISDVDGFWSDSEGNTIEDGIVDFTDFPEGNVEFTFTTVSAQAPCENVTFLYTIEILNCMTSSSLDPAKENISIYPNPTSGAFSIISENASQAKIFDLNGTSLQEFSISAGQNKLDSRKLVAGIYFITIYHESKPVHFQKLVIE